MKQKLWLLISPVVLLGFVALPAIAEPTPDNDTTLQNSVANIRLNRQQREAIRDVSSLAFDQLEAIVAAGFDPGKINRADLLKKASQVGQTLSSVRPDQQQLGELRNILQEARQQVEKQLDTALPVEP